MEKFKVLLYEEMHEEGKTILKEKADIFFAERLDEPYLIDRVRDIDGIIVRANGRASRKVMESAPRLKVVGRHGVGVENIDLEAGTEKGIGGGKPPDAT